jgi:hypothetical protein
MPRPRALPLLLALACGLLFAGCDLFQPRTPEPPSQAGVRIDYSEPDSTLATMARGIESKAGSNGRTAYLGGLADSSVGDGPNFNAFFDPAAVVIWQNVSGRNPPAEWGPGLEGQLYGYLPTLSSIGYSFFWLTDVEHPNDEDLSLNVKLLHRQYLLAAVAEEGGTPDTLAIGYADLTLTRSLVADKWVVWRWQDRVDPTVGPNPSKGKQSFSALRLGRY